MNTETSLTILDAPVQGPAEANVYSIPAYKLERFQAKVDSANRRLERAGSDARFDFLYEEFMGSKLVGGLLNEETGIWIIQPTAVEVPYIRAIQASPLDLTIGDYTFLAALVAEEAGVTVHTAPGHELGGFEPAGDTHCDHCGIDRNRTRLYLVRENETGRILQLGHTCIELFTGLSPKGLFALQYDEELRGLTADDEGGFGNRDYSPLVADVVALAWAYSNEGKAYVSAKNADWGKISTGQEVRGHLFSGAPRRINFAKDAYGTAAYEKALARFIEAAQVAEALKADADTFAEIVGIASTLDANSDYGRNMSVILAGEHVSGRNIGIAASIVSVYAREKELAVKRANKVPAAEGFLAPIKTRIKTNIELTISQARQREGDYGWTTWIVGTAQDGHVVVWNASRAIDLEPGDTLILSAATVKAHETYRGTDQTVVTRAVIAD